jgi:hypothetical protein
MRLPLTILSWLLSASTLWSQVSTMAFRCSIQGYEFVNGAAVAVSGSGMLYLQGDVLRYDITVMNLQNLPAETHFHADKTDLRVSLAPYTYRPANGSGQSGTFFDGSMSVTDYRDSLLAGHWYVQLHSPNYENSVMRGYVIPVPEPGIAALAAVGVLIGAWRRLKGRAPGEAADKR